MENWLPDLAAATLATFKGYYGAKTFSLYTGSKASASISEFVPNQHCETYQYEFQYPIPGADVVQTNVILTQMLGAELASKRSVRRKHPWIDGDGEEEQAYIDEEQIEALVLDLLRERVATGAAPMMLLVYFEKFRREDPAGDAITALDKANTKLQEEQAKMAEEQPEGSEFAAPPPAMPGADAAAGGAAQQMPVPQAPVPGPTPGQEGVRELFNAIAAGTRDVGMR